MMSKPMAMSMLVLRVLALVSSFVALIVIATAHFEFTDEFGDDTTVKFQTIKSYRFVVAVEVISTAYGIMQLPFAVYYAVKQKRLISNGFSREFDFYGDKVISMLLGVGTGVGFQHQLN